jgi:hypothetical protein
MRLITHLPSVAVSMPAPSGVIRIRSLATAVAVADTAGVAAAIAITAAVVRMIAFLRIGQLRSRG